MSYQELGQHILKCPCMVWPLLEVKGWKKILSDTKETNAHKFQFTETRKIIREQAVQAALDLLRRKLLGISSEAVGSEE